SLVCVRRTYTGSIMQKTIRQHYVPRFYLSRFADPASGNLWVFDKSTNRRFETSAWNVAQERCFYDLHPDSIKKEYREAGIDPQAIEKALAVVEGYFA